ncbi:MAG: hypothetical protein K2O18_13130 [Oscillospiraceae bacterium]|nr:hypothetical protein [Oscillospiraceae bacterium]
MEVEENLGYRTTFSDIDSEKAEALLDFVQIGSAKTQKFLPNIKFHWHDRHCREFLYFPLHGSSLLLEGHPTPTGQSGRRISTRRVMLHLYMPAGDKEFTEKVR